MRLTLQDRLLRRGLGERSKYTSIPGFYGDKAWIDDLDIVNELGGHSGCVNALSWSKSGCLLASGSDDLHLNIHRYQPEDSTAPFALTTTVSTGHTANIFSVKFMPHSSDRTIVTAAGDAEVRVFDIEYSARSRIAPTQPSPSSSRSRGLNNLYNGVRYLSDGDTNARIYRSHSDRVKRIVTENSPYLFMTCSEDGEVRQWDTRQPNSYYPASNSGGRRRFSQSTENSESTNVPPPLISYKRYHLDINTISCSPYQPYYIALGGAHLHCFLHDRRMSGRDILAERGQLGVPSSSGSSSSRDDDLLSAATRCVRKFAPNGAKTMRKMDNCHITACKISDANPNEMIVSWSGEWIYSFDLIHSPDADEIQSGPSQTAKRGKGKGKAKESADRKDRKRKRGPVGSSSSLEEDGRETSKQRDDANEGGDYALRVRYEHGQSEDITIEPPCHPMDPSAGSVISEAREASLTESQRRGYRLAKALVYLRKEIFGLKSSSDGQALPRSTNELTLHTASFTAGLGIAASYLPVIDDITGTWRYPVDPAEEDVAFQSILRNKREATRRFVQAAGTLARVMGGTIQTASSSESPMTQQFRRIGPAPNERNTLTSSEEFCYDFLRAILSWIEGGRSGLVQEFKAQPTTQKRHLSRFPVPLEAGQDAIQEVIIPRLLRLAGERSIPNVDASRFERDEYRLTFKTEKAAVTAFNNAIEIPFQTGESSENIASSRGEISIPAIEGLRVQDRNVAARFWGFKVGRGILMNAAEGINFAYVDRAFGGLGLSTTEDDGVQEDIILSDDDVAVDIDTVIQPTSSGTQTNGNHETNSISRSESQEQGIDASTQDSPPPYSSLAATARSPSEEELFLEDLGGAFEVRIGFGNNDDEEEDGDDDEEGDSDDDVDHDSGEDDSEAEGSEEGHVVWEPPFNLGGTRSKVNKNVPCSSHTRQYRGHCNVKTVKDVNFFGLQDEYVVSGSDSGHVFIWDKKTSELVNILKGDGEVVNVVQGHPYEPMLAVSGIDHTIKIFSPDQQAQEDARNGVNICHRGDSGWSSLEFGIIRSRTRPRRRSTSLTRNPPEAGPASRGLASCKRMSDSYSITSKNDIEREGGMREAFLTREMLATLLARLRDRQAGGAGLSLMLLTE